MKEEYAIYMVKETVLQSIYKDLVSLVVISFCVYISQDSTWWTFVTGLMFILFVGTRVSSVIEKKRKFRTKQELLEWVNSLPDEK